MSSSELQIVKSEQERSGATAGFVRITNGRQAFLPVLLTATRGCIGAPTLFPEKRGNIIPSSKRGLHRLDGRTLTNKQKRILFPRG